MSNENPTPEELLALLTPRERHLAGIARAVYQHPSGHPETIRAMDRLEREIHQELGTKDLGDVSRKGLNHQFYALRAKPLQNAMAVWEILPGCTEAESNRINAEFAAVRTAASIVQDGPKAPGERGKDSGTKGPSLGWLLAYSSLLSEDSTNSNNCMTACVLSSDRRIKCSCSGSISVVPSDFSISTISPAPKLCVAMMVP